MPSGTDGGYDISWVQCGGAYPTNPVFGVVGVSNGSAFHDNPCLADEYHWAAAAPSNMADIQGMLDYLNSQSGVTPGIYSSGSQWAQITGGAVLSSTPVWVPYAQQRSQAPSFCDAAYSFTGGPVSLVQYPAGSFDGDYAC